MKKYKIITAVLSAAILLPNLSFALSPAQYADLVSIQVSAQDGILKAGKNTSATFVVTLTRTGFGDRYADMSFSGLTNVGGSFSANPVEFQAPGPTGQFNSATSILTLTTNSSTPSQNVCFTVTAAGANTISTNKCVVISGRRSIWSFIVDLLTPSVTKKVPTVSTINILTGKIGTR